METTVLNLPDGFKIECNIIFGCTEEGLFHIKLHRPKKKNALSRDMYHKLHDLLVYANKLEEARVVLVYGANGDFCAGNDMQDFLNREPECPVRMNNLMMAFATLEKPLYFFIQGCSVGITATYVTHADFAYCSEDAFFYTPFMSLTLVPEGLSSIKFPEFMGRRKANEVLYTDQRVTAQVALESRFINGIIKKVDLPNTESIITEIDKLPLLRKLLNGDPKTVQNAKRLLIQAQPMARYQAHNLLEQRNVQASELAPGFKDHVRKYMSKNVKQSKPKQQTTKNSNNEERAKL
eukprot:403346038